jgi:hypothetical protein
MVVTEASAHLSEAALGGRGLSLFFGGEEETFIGEVADALAAKPTYPHARREDRLTEVHEQVV